MAGQGLTAQGGIGTGPRVCVLARGIQPGCGVRPQGARQLDDALHANVAGAGRPGSTATWQRGTRGLQGVCKKNFSQEVRLLACS